MRLIHQLIYRQVWTTPIHSMRKCNTSFSSCLSLDSDASLPFHLQLVQDLLESVCTADSQKNTHKKWTFLAYFQNLANMTAVTLHSLLFIDLSMAPDVSRMRSASVDFPWSTWATMLKFRIRSGGKSAKFMSLMLRRRVGSSVSENGRSEIRINAGSPRQGQQSRRLTVRIILKMETFSITSQGWFYRVVRRGAAAACDDWCRRCRSPGRNRGSSQQTCCPYASWDTVDNDIE